MTKLYIIYRCRVLSFPSCRNHFSFRERRKWVDGLREEVSVRDSFEKQTNKQNKIQESLQIVNKQYLLPLILSPEQTKAFRPFPLIPCYLFRVRVRRENRQTIWQMLWCGKKPLFQLDFLLVPTSFISLIHYRRPNNTRYRIVLLFCFCLCFRFTSIFPKRSTTGSQYGNLQNRPSLCYLYTEVSEFP